MIFTKNYKTAFENYISTAYAPIGATQLMGIPYIVKYTTCDGFTRYGKASHVDKVITAFSKGQAFDKTTPAKILTPGTSSPAADGELIAKGLVFGTGTTAPTENDITLETPFSDVPNFNIARYFKGRISNGTWHQKVSFVITNNGSSSVTFNEIGFCYTFATNATVATYGTTPSGSSSVYNQYLLARHVFPSAVTIAAAETIQLDLDISQQLGSSTDYPDVAEWTITY